jgi:antitoxin (DNA-binding transcriptional repressor) of toxin-antitoxin stability system
VNIVPVTTLEVTESDARLQEVLSLVSAGTEVVLSRAGQPVARVVAFASPRIPGLHAGAISTTPDFDEPLLEEFWTGAP